MAIVATNNSGVLLGAIRELAEYKGENAIATAFNVGNSFYATNEVWRARNPKTPAEIMAHYRTCKPQVEQQVFATYGIPGEVALRKRMETLHVDTRDGVLDFGAGIGSQLLPFVVRGYRCTHVDVGGVMVDYAFWRYLRAQEYTHLEYGGTNLPRHMPARVDLHDDYMTARIPELEGRTFGLVICTEVIEHVPEPEKLVVLLASLVNPGGLCVATTSFHDDDGTIPMHLNVDKYDDETFAAEVFPRNGLVRVEEHVFRKV
jgi:2-polyprenyl-3-methyl-5-hydroxy-6-metoxy-1,4-benzoquinol methylase